MAGIKIIRMAKFKIVIVIVLLLQVQFSNVFAQKYPILDQIVATVGGDKILLSEIEQQAMQMRLQGYSASGDVQCEVLEEILNQKLLIDQARIDSVEITAGQVNGEVDRRINYFVSNIGSEEAVEKYFNKSMSDIKRDLNKVIEQQLLTQRMQQNIVSDVFVTPTEVKKFYKNTSSDSLPLLNDQMEIQQIVLYPQADDIAKLEVRKKLLALRERIIKGEKFSTLAILYGEDGSARNGGELGFSSRNEFVKEFSDVAFNLKKGQVSQIVETEFGFHVIQLIQRKGDRINCRHILMKPKVTPEMISKVKIRLDSITDFIQQDSLTFDLAAKMFSEDEDTRMNGGIMLNPVDRSAKFEKEHLSPADYYAIKDLETGVISKPFESTEKNKTAYKIIRVNNRIESHRANIDNDYDMIVNIAEGNKKEKVLEEWLDKKRSKTFIRIRSPFTKCKFKKQDWLSK